MNSIVYVGYPGFPEGLAQVQRQLLIAKGLAEQGCRVLVLNRYGVQNKKPESTIKTTGNYEGVDYKFCSGTPFRPKNFITRNLLKLIGFFAELKILLSERLKNNTKTMIITSNNFINIFYYTLVARMLNMTSVIDQVEYWSAYKLDRKNRIGPYLNDRYYGRLCNKAIVISDFLLEKLKEQRNTIPAVKIPAICDFTKFSNGTKPEKGTDYFLFCGSAYYFEVIKFVIDAYMELHAPHGLVLVTSGENQKIERVKCYLQLKHAARVTLKSNIPYNELVSLYKNSLALLIPLRPTLQDVGRFPHKIGEYTASKRPIISTKIGEVASYFEDGENAFLSSTYNVFQFSRKMQEVIDNPVKREKIAEQSFLTGKKEFDYKKNGTKLYEFLF